MITRFGIFQYLDNNDLLKNKNNETSFLKTMTAAGIFINNSFLNNLTRFF